MLSDMSLLLSLVHFRCFGDIPFRQHSALKGDVTTNSQCTVNDHNAIHIKIPILQQQECGQNPFDFSGTPQRHLDLPTHMPIQDQSLRILPSSKYCD